MDQTARDAHEVNHLYYGRTTQGRDEYWRKMAAPRHRVQVLLRQLERLAPRSLVDLGCGNGVLLSEVRGLLPHASFAGLDLSREQIDENRRLTPWATWEVSNLETATALPVQMLGAFDAVMATEVIEHLDSPEQLLRNARHLARPGGHLLLSTQSGAVHDTERRVGHRRHFSREEIERLLTTTGWTSERVWNTGFPFHDLSKWYANLDPDGSMARFGGQAYGWKENLVCRALRLAFLLNSSRRGAQLFAVARRGPD